MNKSDDTRSELAALTQRNAELLATVKGMEIYIDSISTRLVALETFCNGVAAGILSIGEEDHPTDKAELQ